MLRRQLAAAVAELVRDLDAANRAREIALPACRRAVRSSGLAVRAVHRLDFAAADRHVNDAEVAVREAGAALAAFPALVHAGFLSDAEKELVEAKATIALVRGLPVPTSDELGVLPQSWMKGLCEAASELRRHLLDRLRGGDIGRAEELLSTMDDVYDSLVAVDHPDALTGGLRRSLDSLRAVLERSRGDLTTTIVGARLQRAIEGARHS